MEANSWLIIQITIDIIIGALLIWFIKSRNKDIKSGHELKDALLESETVLDEIRELSRALDRNLEEKRALSRQILGQLDESLEKAEDSCEQLQKLLREYGSNIPAQNESRNNTEKTRDSVMTLLAKGLSKEEVSRHLEIPLGEMELLLKFQKQASDGNRLSLHE